ncbi:MAG: hypothetical protein IKR63_02230 [Alloprevotella sp.]|nr:hypothetical protein [Alloprevotella sp.]
MQTECKEKELAHFLCRGAAYLGEAKLCKPSAKKKSLLIFFAEVPPILAKQSCANRVQRKVGLCLFFLCRGAAYLGSLQWPRATFFCVNLCNNFDKVFCFVDFFVLLGILRRRVRCLLKQQTLTIHQ